MRRNPKTLRWGAFLLLCLLALIVPAALVYRSHTVPLSQCSELYRRYVGNPHLRSSFTQDFPINDTLALDVLLIEADSDSAWCALLIEFGMPKEMMEEYLSDTKKYEGNGSNIISLFTIDKNNPQKRLSLEEIDSRIVSVSFARKSLCVFLTENKTIKEAISDGKIHKLYKSNNQKKQSNR